MSNFYYYISTLVNLDDILKVGFYYSISTLINPDDILKITACYLTSTMTNTNDKAKNIIKRRSITSNQLFNSLLLGDNLG